MRTRSSLCRASERGSTHISKRNNSASTKAGHPTMPVEIEAKMRVADLEGVRRKLRELAASRLGRTFEINRFFDAPDHRLRKVDQGLRLRTNRDVDSGRDAHVVTMKGPRQQGKFKMREELEFTTGDVAATTQIFER